MYQLAPGITIAPLPSISSGVGVSGGAAFAFGPIASRQGSLCGIPITPWVSITSVRATAFQSPLWSPTRKPWHQRQICESFLSGLGDLPPIQNIHHTLKTFYWSDMAWGRVQADTIVLSGISYHGMARYVSGGRPSGANTGKGGHT